MPLGHYPRESSLNPIVHPLRITIFGSMSKMLQQNKHKLFETLQVTKKKKSRIIVKSKKLKFVC